MDIIHRLREVPEGGVLAIEGEGITEDVQKWSQVTQNPVLEIVALDEGRERIFVRKGAVARNDDDAQNGSARLWIYTNFDCNLACDYCCVRSSPTAERRRLTPSVIAARAREAKALGFRTVLLTGGEPFLHPEIGEMALAAASQLPTIILTNGSLFTGARRAALESLPRDRVTLQISLDSPTPDTHDGHRGAGSWAKAREGIAIARDLGFRVRIAATTTTSGENDAFHALLDELDIPRADRVIRPLARRGNAEAGVPLARSDLVPELTLTAKGWYWHPVGATDDDFVVTRDEVALARVVEIAERLSEADKRHRTYAAEVFHCA